MSGPRSVSIGMVTLVLLAILPVIAIMIYSGFEYRERKLDLLEEEAHDLLRTIAFNKHSEVENARTLLLAIAQIDSVRDRDARAVGSLFRGILSQTPFYSCLGLVDLDGTFVTGAPADKYDVGNAHELAMNAFFAQGFHIGLGGFDPLTGEHSLEFSYPVYSADGSPVAAIIGAMRIDTSNFPLAGTVMLKDAYLEFLDRIGTVLFSLPGSNPNPVDSAAQGVYVQAAEERGGVLNVTLPSGSKRTLVYKKLFLDDSQEPYMLVIYSTRKTIAAAEANTVLGRTLVLLGISFLPGLLALYFIGRRSIAARIQSLLTTARLLARGDLSARTELPSFRGDLGALVQSFNTMAESLEMRNLELLQARRASDEHNAAKDEFLAAMSHAIRTPMNSIIGIAYLLLKSPLTDKQQNYLRRIYAAGTTLLGIINDILDFSNIESGNFSIEHAPFSVRQVVDDTLALYMQKAVENNTTLSSVVRNDVPDRLIGDPGRLGQIITNLLGNALKFTEEGEVILVCERDRKSCWADGSQPGVTLTFVVHDTGIGMSREQQKRLFSAFSQADDSISKRYGGTGLGLAISKRLVKLMHGSIGLDSEEGYGTRVVVKLAFPLEQAAEIRPRSSASRDAANVCRPGTSSDTWSGSFDSDADGVDRRLLAGKRILLVEDNQINQEIVAELVCDAGAQLTVAENGKVALEYLPRNISSIPFDIVLMDVNMPVMDGYEATRCIRSMPIYRDMPIIAMTAHAMLEEVERSFAAGMNAHIAKPIEVSRFFEVIVRALEGGERPTV